jgi:hypothetical protein
VEKEKKRDPEKLDAAVPHVRSVTAGRDGLTIGSSMTLFLLTYLGGVLTIVRFLPGDSLTERL